MGEPDLLALARQAYEAYETGERSLIERLLAEDFRFSSPADVGIDRARYFERCWPNAQSIAGYEFPRMIQAGDQVIVTYEAARNDGSRFRNTEILTFSGEQLSSVEVYFGWNLDQPGSEA